MSELESPEKHSSDLLNRIIDHAHLTGRDYLMALAQTRERDAAVATQARLELLAEAILLVNQMARRHNAAPAVLWPGVIEELRVKYVQAEIEESDNG